MTKALIGSYSVRRGLQQNYLWVKVVLLRILCRLDLALLSMKQRTHRRLAVRESLVGLLGRREEILVVVGVHSITFLFESA